MTRIEINIIETKSDDLYISCSAICAGKETELEKRTAIKLAPIIRAVLDVEVGQHATTKSTP